MGPATEGRSFGGVWVFLLGVVLGGQGKGLVLGLSWQLWVSIEDEGTFQKFGSTGLQTFRQKFGSD